MRHYNDNNMKYGVGLSLLGFTLLRHIVRSYVDFIFILNTLYTCLSGSYAINSTNQTIKWLVFDGKAENYPAWRLEHQVHRVYANERFIQSTSRERDCTRRNSTVSRGCLK